MTIKLLKYDITFSKTYNSKFYIYNYIKQYFNYTQQYKINLISFKNIISKHIIKNILKKKKYSKNSNYQYQNLYHSLYNKKKKRYTNKIKKPSQTSVYKILKNYILFNTPTPIQTKLNNLLKKYNKINQKINKTKNNIKLNQLNI